MASRVSAHKGGAEHARAATYEAYEDAVTSGAEYAEFDIRRTRDGALVVYHDAAAGPRWPAWTTPGCARRRATGCPWRATSWRCWPGMAWPATWT
jgi:glycerophosphoryl diester phosphodiesterase